MGEAPLQSLPQKVVGEMVGENPLSPLPQAPQRPLVPLGEEVVEAVNMTPGLQRSGTPTNPSLQPSGMFLLFVD